MKFKNWFETALMDRKRSTVSGGWNFPPTDDGNDGDQGPDPDWVDVFIRWMDSDDNGSRNICEVISAATKPTRVSTYVEPSHMSYPAGDILVTGEWSIKDAQIVQFREELIHICDASPLWKEIVNRPAAICLMDQQVYFIFMQHFLVRKYRQQPLMDFYIYLRDTSQAIPGKWTVSVPYLEYIKHKVSGFIMENLGENVPPDRIALKAGFEGSHCYCNYHSNEGWRILAVLTFNYLVK